MESPSPTAATSPTIRSSINTLTPWFSAITSILVIGLPHAYYGAWRRAIGFLAAGAALSALAIAALGRFPLSLTICLGLVTWSFYVWVAIDAVRLSRSAARAARPSSASRWLGAAGFLIVSLITSGLISAPLRRAGLDAYRLPTSSMAPTLLAGDYLIAVPIDTRGRVTRGSLVTYRDTRNSALMMLKRVVAIGGDTIAMQRGQVILNGRTIDEPYARTVGTGPGALEEFNWQRKYLASPLQSDDPYYHPTADDWGPLVAPPGYVFVLGDNRHDSMDSRYTGFVPTGNIIGSPRRIYFSRDPDTGHVRWGRIGKRLR